jgi:hypothetical protein
MKKSHLLGALCVFTLAPLVQTAHAALVNQLLGLNIDGTLYNVTFHTGSGDSFNALWDANNDGAFGGGGSVFSSAPTFWGDQTGAQAAAAAIIAALGTTDTTVAGSPGSDSFYVPFGTVGPPLSSFTDSINVYTDTNTNTPTFSDSLSNVVTSDIFDPTQFYPYASFEVVPVPAALWLFGSGLLGLIRVARRKVRV